MNLLSDKLAGKDEKPEKPLSQEETQKIAAYAAMTTVPFVGLYTPIIDASWHPPMAAEEGPVSADNSEKPPTVASVPKLHTKSFS